MNQSNRLKKSKIVFSIAALLFVCLSSLTNSFAQTESQSSQADRSYEIILQTLIASNNASDKSAASVPPVLSSVVRKLKANYALSNYRLTSTFLQRVTNKAEFEIKSVSSTAGENQENGAPVFFNWSVGAVESLSNEKGRSSIQFQGFRYGQRVPVAGPAGVINYEQIGLTLKKLNLPENVPTVVGSLATSKPDEMMFLVLTVKPVEE